MFALDGTSSDLVRTGSAKGRYVTNSNKASIFEYENKSSLNMLQYTPTKTTPYAPYCLLNV